MKTRKAIVHHVHVSSVLAMFLQELEPAQGGGTKSYIHITHTQQALDTIAHTSNVHRQTDNHTSAMTTALPTQSILVRLFLRGRPVQDAQQVHMI